MVTTNKTRIASSVPRVLEKISVDHFRANGGGLKNILKKKTNCSLQELAVQLLVVRRNKNSVGWWVFDFVDTLSSLTSGSFRTNCILFLEMLNFFSNFYFSQKKIFFLGEKRMKNVLEDFQSSKLINYLANMY